MTDIYGALCARCERRYCLTADRATCTHVNVCEDCWPNGCDECEATVTSTGFFQRWFR